MSTAQQVALFKNGDPLFENVLYLLKDDGTFPVDSSSYARGLLKLSGLSLSSTQTLFGRQTWQVGANNQKISINGGNDRFLAAGNHSQEWCIEGWYYFTGAVGVDNNFLDFGGGSAFTMKRNTLGRLSANCANIGGSSLGLGSLSTTYVAPNVWTHVAWVRDNTTDPTFGYMRMYVNGVLGASSASFGKGATLSDASAGFNVLGGVYSFPYEPHFFSETRITKGSARYYANFTPPSAPFPTV